MVVSFSKYDQGFSAELWSKVPRLPSLPEEKEHEEL